MSIRLFLGLFSFVACLFSNAMIFDQNSLNQKLFEILDQKAQPLKFSAEDKGYIRELIKSGANIKARGRASDRLIIESLFPGCALSLVAISTHISTFCGYYD